MISHYVAAIPLLEYGHGNGAPLDDEEIRARLADIRPPHWNHNYLAAHNLAPYLRFVKHGWDMCGTATQHQLPFLYIEQHRSLLRPEPIGTWPNNNAAVPW